MKGRILLVDDNEDFLDSTKDILEEEGYEVLTASSGEEAIERAQRQIFHVVVMDIKMPGMNGVEAFVEIKKLNPGVKVIMCTAYIVEHLIRQALEEGAYAVLNKPFEMEVLLRMIDNARLQSGIGGVILVADRDEELCAELERVLTTQGHHVIVAHNGPAALEKTRSHSFDILLIEADLPGINGLEIYRRVKGTQPEILAAIIVGPDKGTGPNPDPALPREKGLTGLNKPLDMAQLVELLESICAAERL